MKKNLFLIGIVVLGLVVVATLAKHREPGGAAGGSSVSLRTAPTNAPPPSPPAGLVVTNTPAAGPQQAADLYTEVITRVEAALNADMKQK